MPGKGEFARLKPVPLFTLRRGPSICYGSRCMNGVLPLEFAGVSHWAALAVLLAAGLCIMELGQSYKKAVRNRTTFWLGIACLFSLVPDLAAILADEPEKSWAGMLPLHFCSVMQVFCALSLWIPSRLLRSIVYYCVLCATLQGLITPSVSHDFPSWTYFAFFLSHGVTVITALYLPLALEWKPARWDFLWALLFANVYLAVIHPVNMLLGTNYGFTVATPAGGSVLDLLGPWPWYLLWMQIPALVLMYLLTLPFRHYPKGRTGSSLFHP